MTAALVAGLATALVGARVGAATGPGTNGDPVTFPQVACTAHLSGGVTLTQKQDITVQVVVPNQVGAGATYPITIPGGTATLPSTGSGIPITGFKNLTSTFALTGGATIVSASASGGATINGSPTPFGVTHTASTVSLATPGPIPPGTFTTPDVTAQVQAPNATATVDTVATEIDTTVTLSGLGDVSVTCPLPSTVISSTQVVAGATTTTAASTTTTAASTTTTTTAASTTTTTTAASTTTTTTAASTTTTAPPSGPALAVDDPSVVRPDSKTAKLVFTVTLSPPSPSRTVSVRFTTRDGTAHQPADYRARHGTLTFPKGRTTRTVTVLVTGGTVGVPDRTVLLELSNPKNATIADGEGVGTIVDNHPAGIAIGDASLPEPGKGSAPMPFAVTLTKPAKSTITVDFATRDGTARARRDYVATSGTLTFHPGDSGAEVDVKIRSDRRKEPDRQFTVVLSNPTGGAVIVGATGTGTILE